jgi:hypothetical protein
MDVITTWSFANHTIRAGLVSTQAERLACLRLRYLEYHHGQRSIDSNDDELDLDWADEFSTMLCSTLDDDPTPIGTMRLIHCEHGCLLTRGYDERPAMFSRVPYAIPRHCPITGRTAHTHETVEGSRYVARIIELEPWLRVLHSNLLLDSAMRWCLSHGIRQMIGAMREHQWRNLVNDGLRMAETIRRSDGRPHRLHGMDYRDVFIPVSSSSYEWRRTLPVPSHVALAA